MKAEIEIMIRVKLPSSSGYASCPSGDTAYDADYKKAIFDAKPPGYEVKWPRGNERWPRDSEGFTFIPLYVTDTKHATEHWLESYTRVKKELDRVRAALKELI